MAEREEKQEDGAEVAMDGPERAVAAAAEVTISDIIGQFGWYQLSLCLFSFIRFWNVGMMTSIGPLIAPDMDFRCNLSEQMKSLVDIPHNLTYQEYALNRCSLDMKSMKPYKCDTWEFNTTGHGLTLTDSYNLVCDRNWLRSAFQSIISLGVLACSIFAGPFSDRLGRYFTAKLSFFLSLVGGLASCFIEDFVLFSIFRCLCTFFDLALVYCISTNTLEMLGNKYRGAAAIVTYTGWAVGVMVMPWVMELCGSYKRLMLFSVACHLVTLPWLLTIRESARSLLVRGLIEEARDGFKYISRFNGNGNQKTLSEVDRKFDILKIKFVKAQEEEKQEWKGCLSILPWLGLGGVGQLFSHPELARTTLTMILLMFTGEFFYQFLILINSDVGSSIKLNYAIGGVMELLATAVSTIMTNKMPRKLAMVLTMVLLAVSSVVLAVSFSAPVASMVVLNVAKFVVSTLTSLLYVILIEAFPTSIRQTGMGFCCLFSSFGSLIAPFMRTELADYIGFTNVLLIITALPVVSTILAPLYLRETKDIELADDMEDVDTLVRERTRTQEVD